MDLRDPRVIQSIYFSLLRDTKQLLHSMIRLQELEIRKCDTRQTERQTHRWTERHKGWNSYLDVAQLCHTQCHTASVYRELIIRWNAEVWSSHLRIHKYVDRGKGWNIAKPACSFHSEGLLILVDLPASMLIPTLPYIRLTRIGSQILWDICT